MYGFTNMDINPSINSPTRPVEAINYGGHWLDDEITGYTTLVVSGRHMFSRKINDVDLTGDGNMYLSSKLERRVIEVKFLIKTESIAEYNRQMEQLNIILSKPHQRLYFADYPEAVYTGTVTEIKMENDILNDVGTITIECSDPFAYSSDQLASGTGNSFQFPNAGINYGQTPETIIFNPSADIGSLTVSNGDKKIEINQGITANAKVLIDFNALDVVINEVSALMNVTLDSNLGDFYIKDGDTIRFSTNGKYEIRYRVKKL
ncbi:distal tail protein Dit [Limosilactobacillus reuteri]|nr:distal tail protein Dit [Limosilactobacillus reuteri]